ncbi:MAG: DegV family protein [Lachnospiraceae bacterium]
MNNYIITTDSTCDLPGDFYSEHQIPVLSLSCILDGETYNDSHPIDEDAFYKKMRAGSMPSTSQVNPEEAKKVFEKILKEQQADILHLAFSSGLSGSCNSAKIAAEELMEEYPGTKIVVVDTLCASMGEGLLLYKAIQQKNAGKSIDELQAWLEENKYHLCHNFTVDDLFHLHRGGRVSKATAILGTMINIKPILHVDDEGHLINIGKTRGRKRSLIALVDRMEQQLGKYRDQNDMIMISHGDAKEDAEFVAGLVRERFGYETFMINYVGPVIGSHSGPGTLALFFMGEYR